MTDKSIQCVLLALVVIVSMPAFAVAASGGQHQEREASAPGGPDATAVEVSSVDSSTDRAATGGDAAVAQPTTTTTASGGQQQTPQQTQTTQRGGGGFGFQTPQQTQTTQRGGGGFGFPTTSPGGEGPISAVETEVEPNDLPAQADPLALGSPVAGELSSPTDRDVYQVTVSQTTTLSALLETTASGTVMYGILSSDGTVLAAALASQGQPGQAATQTPVQPGIYYAVVIPSEDNPGTGSYVLSVDTPGGAAVTPTPAPTPTPSPVQTEAEPNDAPAQANPLALGSAITGELSSPTDRDVYQVTVSQTTTLSALLETTASGTVMYGILSTDGTVLATALASQGQPGQAVTQTSVQPGAYYVVVLPYEENPATGPYALSVSEGGIAPTPTPSPDPIPDPSADPNEPNDDLSSATFLQSGTVLSGEISGQSDIDVFAIPAQTGENITVEIDRSAGAGGITYTWLTPDQSVIDSGVYPWESIFSQIYNTADSGTYYLVLQYHNWTGSYEIGATVSPYVPPSASASQASAVASVTNGPGGENQTGVRSALANATGAFESPQGTAGADEFHLESAMTRFVSIALANNSSEMRATPTRRPGTLG